MTHRRIYIFPLYVHARDVAVIREDRWHTREARHKLFANIVEYLTRRYYNLFVDIPAQCGRINPDYDPSPIPQIPPPPGGSQWILW